MVFSPEISKKTERYTRSSQSTRTLGAFSLGMNTLVNDAVTVHTEINPGADTVVYLFPGYRQQVPSVRDAIQPFIADAGTVRYFGWPKRQYSDASLEDAVLESLDEDEGMALKVIGISNGGKEALHQFAKPEIQQAAGEIASWNFESTPGGIDDIHRSYRAILSAGNTLNPNSRACQALFRAMMNTFRSTSIYHSDAADHDTVQNVSRMTANTPLGASISQLESLSRILPDDGSTARLGLLIKEANYFAAPIDAVVDTKHSHARFSNNLERNINYIVDHARYHPQHEKSHAGVTEHPELFAKVLKYGYANVFTGSEVTASL